MDCITKLITTHNNVAREREKRIFMSEIERSIHCALKASVYFILLMLFKEIIIGFSLKTFKTFTVKTLSE